MAQTLHKFNLPCGDYYGPLVRSITGVMNALKVHPVCSAAGDNGAITVWCDGQAYHCEFSSRWLTRGYAMVDTKKEVRWWLREWFWKIK